MVAQILLKYQQSKHLSHTTQKRATYILKEFKVIYKSKDSKEEKVFDVLDCRVQIRPNDVNSTTFSLLEDLS